MPTRARPRTLCPGKFTPSEASIRFAVCDDGTGVIYKSDDAGQVTVGAGVGKERNGVFSD